MEKEVVIKPPMEAIKSGKVFYPDVRFKYKMWIGNLWIAFVFYLAAVLTWLGTAFMMYFFDAGYPIAFFWSYVGEWWGIFNFWWWVINLI
ncbi:MAG: hypothetical protein ACFE7R_00560, partial [Candidatus Hodarchaeota archaeon]